MMANDRSVKFHVMSGTLISRVRFSPQVLEFPGVVEDRVRMTSPLIGD